MLDLDRRGAPRLPGARPTCERRSRTRTSIQRARPVGRRRCSRRIPQLDEAEWCTTSWLDEALREAPLAFDGACDRWRELYRARSTRATARHTIANDLSRARQERGSRTAAREAEAQIELLRGGDQAKPPAVRLLQLPLLRQRGLPARLQLPAAAAVGVHPRPARPQGEGRVPPAAPVPRDLRVRAALDRLPRRLPLPHQPGLPAR